MTRVKVVVMPVGDGTLKGEGNLRLVKFAMVMMKDPMLNRGFRQGGPS